MTLRRQPFVLFHLVLLAIATSTTLVFGGDWTRFRGPNGSGVSTDKQPTPVEWSAEKNLKWKVELPGAGVSCPIVVGDKIFVTCYSGYGVERRAGDQKDLMRHLVCIDRKTSKIDWKKDIAPYLPEDAYSGMGVPEHGYASHTPVSDGKNVYCFFGKTGAMAFDMQGKELWKTSLGTRSDRRRWGSAASPILYKDLLIVNASAEAEAMVALDTKTGEEKWRAEAGGFADCWGTPLLVKVNDERTDLVLGVAYEYWGFDPNTGKLKWYADAIPSDSMNSSLVAYKDTVIGIEGRSGGSAAIRVGGKDNVSDTHEVWKGRHANRFSTPIVFGDRVYFFSRGIANCLNAKTGDEIYQERMEGGGGSSSRGGRFGGSSDYASPVIADGKIYYMKRNGDMFVFAVGDKFKQLATNRVTDANEDFSASPAISNGELFIRSNKHLYCVAIAK